jgi:hypothetical protein
LHHVIGKLIVNHLGHGTGADHLLDHEDSIIRGPDTNALQSEGPLGRRGDGPSR